MIRHTLYTPCTHPVHRARHALLAVGSSLLTLMAVPTTAQTVETFNLPAGCEAFMTVQSKDCTVDHHFICEGDPEGHKQRVSLDEEGLTYLGSIDEETQWVQSFHPRSGHSERLAPSNPDPASFSELINNGVDTYDFQTLSDEVGPSRFVGMDQLTGRTVTIDGVTLEETEYQITAYDGDGNEMWSSKGNELISRERRMFFSGPGVVTVPSGTFEEDDGPVEFIFPGEAGFLSANPKHGCGVVLSNSPVSELKEFLNVEL